MEQIKEMYLNTQTKHPRVFKLGRFLISGGIGASINIGILFFLTHFLNIWYLLSSIVAFIISICVSFILQKIWTFKNVDTDNVHVQAAWYAVIALVNLGLNTLLMYGFVEGLGLHYIPSQILASILIAVESYFIYHKLFTHDIVQR